MCRVAAFATDVRSIYMRDHRAELETLNTVGTSDDLATFEPPEPANNFLERQKLLTSNLDCMGALTHRLARFEMPCLYVPWCSHISFLLGRTD